MDDLYIRKVCEGDTNAFRYFLKEYKDMAFSIAVSVVKDPFLAEEVVQDAFLKTFNGLPAFNKRSKFSTWFYRIVVNESLMRLKRIKREIVSFEGLPGHNLSGEDLPDNAGETGNEGLLDSIREEEQSRLINKALERLDPRESLALRLFYLQEESIKGVCELTGWSEANTKVILFRARRNMFALLRTAMKTNP
ncbi:MAG: RNA polymerase sigma factor [Puia sp.]|nr:RNA polymerase sigma factor [Puia sp.]